MSQQRRPLGRIASAIRYLLDLPWHVKRLEREVVELRSEVDELRRDGRKVAELYDFVLEEIRPHRDAS